MPNSCEIGERLRIARKNAGLKQDDIARYLGIGNSTISEWETGKRSPGIDQVEELAKLFGISAGYLLGFADIEEAITTLDISAEALQYAQDFDQLDEEHKRLARGFMLLLMEHQSK